MTKPRPKKVKKRGPPPKDKGYDSWFEYDLHNKQLKGCELNPKQLSYSIPHKYKPDFKFTKPDGTEVFIETKGRHSWARQAEMGKYKHIRACLESNQELVFVLYERNMRFPGARKRKDGTVMTYEEWMETNKFTYYYSDNLPRSWAIRR